MWGGGSESSFTVQMGAGCKGCRVQCFCVSMSCSRFMIFLGIFLCLFLLISLELFIIFNAVLQTCRTHSRVHIPKEKILCC